MILSFSENDSRERALKHSLGKIGFDTAENEPTKIRQTLATFSKLLKKEAALAGPERLPGGSRPGGPRALPRGPAGPAVAPGGRAPAVPREPRPGLDSGVEFRRTDVTRNSS